MSYLVQTTPRQDVRRWLGWLAAGLGFASIVAIALLVSTVAQSSRQRDAALAEQAQSFRIMLLGRTLESTLTNAEVTLARYVLSGDQEIGRAYYAEWRRAGATMTRLERETRRDRHQQALLTELRIIYDRRGKELAATALLTNYGQGLNGLGRFYQAGEAESLTRMTETVEELIVSERANLLNRTDAAGALVESSNRLTRRLSLFGIALIVAAGLLAWLTARAVGERRLADRDSEEASLRADLLEEAVAARTAELSDANARLRAEATERAAAEAQLRQVHKMEAVGKLTGGIAHDFNNMLAVVIGGLELARRRMTTAPDDAARQIGQAMEGAVRAAALTRRLLAFSRAEPLLPSAHDPGSVIGGMTDLLDRTLGERINVRTDVPRDKWPVWVDRHQLENAILNLAVNARDAMAGEGRLTITAVNRTLVSGEVGAGAGGDYVAISVADDGCGMTPEVLDRVFEPFFTTKPVGQGTGLGLSQVFGFVEQSGGEIAIRSTPGAGTAVTMFLPRHRGAVAAATPAAPSVTAAEMPRRVILVVEDDPRVLTATVEALAELGHRAIRCAGPAEAADLMRRHDDIELILTDVVMPGTTGPDLIGVLKRDYPQVGVLFVTGFTGDADESDFGGHDVLRKPFTIDALARAVDRAPGRAAPAAIAA